jgi:fructose-bisphosphate aldolase, class I
MDQQLLATTAQAMVQPGKGLLASDDSASSSAKRFESLGLEASPEGRRVYREALYKTPAAKDALSGIILNDETFWQKTSDGVAIPEFIASQGIIPGVKVDGGLVDLPGFDGEKVVEGLDGLPARLEKYAKAGARFAKWRGVIAIGDNIPTEECIGANAFILARYARLCQDYGIVPIVEPEVMFQGTHTIERCAAVLAHTLDITYQTLRAFRVYLPGTVLKTGMVMPGEQSGIAIDHDAVAEHTVGVLMNHVPHEVGGIVFLSGGQTPVDAAINLNRIAKKGPFPWGVTFSFLRSIQEPVLIQYGKDPKDIAEMHKVAEVAMRQCADACSGTLDESHVVGHLLGKAEKGATY